MKKLRNAIRRLLSIDDIFNRLDAIDAKLDMIEKFGRHLELNTDTFTHILAEFVNAKENEGKK